MKQVQGNANQRVGIFIDVQNLYHSAKNLHHARVNYAELIKHLVAGRQLIRAMAYVVKSEGVEPQRGYEAARPAAARPALGEGGISAEASFFEALEKAGLELRMKDLQIYAGGMKQERVVQDPGSCGPVHKHRNGPTGDHALTEHSGARPEK